MESKWQLHLNQYWQENLHKWDYMHAYLVFWWSLRLDRRQALLLQAEDEGIVGSLHSCGSPNQWEVTFAGPSLWHLQWIHATFAVLDEAGQGKEVCSSLPIRLPSGHGRSSTLWCPQPFCWSCTVCLATWVPSASAMCSYTSDLVCPPLSPPAQITAGCAGLRRFKSFASWQRLVIGSAE